MNVRFLDSLDLHLGRSWLTVVVGGGVKDAVRSSLTVLTGCGFFAQAAAAELCGELGSSKRNLKRVLTRS